MEKAIEEVALYFAEETKNFGYSIPLNGGRRFLTCFNDDLGALLRELVQDLDDAHKQAILVSKVPDYLAGNDGFRLLNEHEMVAAQAKYRMRGIGASKQ